MLPDTLSRLSPLLPDAGTAPRSFYAGRRLAGGGGHAEHGVRAASSSSVDAAEIAALAEVDVVADGAGVAPADDRGHAAAGAAEARVGPVALVLQRLRPDAHPARLAHPHHHVVAAAPRGQSDHPSKTAKIQFFSNRCLDVLGSQSVVGGWSFDIA